MRKGGRDNKVFREEGKEGERGQGESWREKMREREGKRVWVFFWIKVSYDIFIRIFLNDQKTTQF